MGLAQFIWIKNKRYYLYDTYRDWEQALSIAKRQRKKNGSRYFIMEFEHGFVFPEKRYALYMDKTFRVFGGLTLEKCNVKIKTQ